MIFNIIKTPSQFSLSNQIKKKQNKTKVKKQQQNKSKKTTTKKGEMNDVKLCCSECS